MPTSDGREAFFLFVPFEACVHPEFMVCSLWPQSPTARADLCPQNPCAEVLTPESQDGAVFREQIFQAVIKVE